jgi:hypothetical protein
LLWTLHCFLEKSSSIHVRAAVLLHTTLPCAPRTRWDDFEGSSLDRNKWSYDLGNGEWGWGNNELQTYTDNAANVRVAGGNLYITALKDGTSYTSGRINTKQHASFYPGMQVGLEASKA